MSFKSGSSGIREAIYYPSWSFGFECCWKESRRLVESIFISRSKKLTTSEAAKGNFVVSFSIHPLSRLAFACFDFDVCV